MSSAAVQHSLLLKYGTPFAITAAVALIRWLLAPVLHEQAALLPFTLAVLVSAVTGGLLPGLLAAGLSVFVVSVAFPEPGAITLWQPADVVHVSVFLGVALAISMLSQRLEGVLAEAAQSLRQFQSAEQRLTLAQECAGAGVWDWDLERNEAYWSRGYRALLGVGDEVPATFESFLNLVHPDDRDAVEQHARQALLTGQFKTEYRVRHPERGELWLLGSGRTFRDQHGRAVRMTGVAMDITERKRSEQALQESREQLRALTDTMPQFVWSARPDGYIDYFNERWHAYTGTPREAGHGWSWTDHLHEEDREATLAAWQHSIASGDPLDVQFRVRRAADGEHRWFLGRAVPIRGTGGDISRWFGTCTDVDDERRLGAAREALLEGERAARSEMERAIRLREEFVATLSHELRTPLNAVLGWTQMLRKPGIEEATLTRGLEVIERNTRAQAQIISDLIDITRITTGKIRLAAEDADLGSVVRSAVATIRPAAEAKRVSVDVSAGPGVRLMGDAGRLQQVAWNLLSNAVKFTPAGGRIQVVTRRVAAGVELRVTDSGEGIAPGFLPHIFERYRQADSSATRHHGGLGLGLSISKHIIELHGGTIEAHSSGQGKGATFVVRLPAREQRTAVTPTAPWADVSLDSAHVLVVDDQKDARELVARMVADRGARVSVAADADEAVTVFESDPPDVVISDIGMPGADGYELLRRLRRIPGAGRVPAVALTAFARAEDRARSLLAGYQAHLQKPLQVAELVATLDSLLHRSDRAERRTGDVEA